MRRRLALADTQNVGRFASYHPAGWNWRLSAHCRIASLASVWAMVLLSGALGPVLAPFAVARFGFSMAQTWLNVALGRKQPVGRHDRFDVSLMVLIFAGAYFAAGFVHFGGVDMRTPALYLPMLLPFSALQLRMTLRSYRAHDEWLGEERVIPFPVQAAVEAPGTAAADVAGAKAA